MSAGPAQALAADPGGGAARARAPAWMRWVLVALVFLAAAAPFLPALSQGFVDYDDDRNFLLNEAYRGLGADNLRWMFTQNHMGHYHPLTWLTLAVDHELYGLDGAGYHATNLLFHAAGAVALYFLALALLRISFGSLPELRLRLAAAAAALVHAMHPLRVESVAWATERRDVQSGLFLVLTVLAYVGWARRRRSWLLALSLLCYGASLLSKAWGITLPAVLLVLDLYPLRRRAAGAGWGRLLLEKAAYAVPAALVALMAARAQGAAAARETLADHTVLERCVQACYGLCFYVWKTVWPSDLAALYWLEMDVDPLRPAHLAAYVVVGGLTLGLVLARRRFPAGLAAWVAFAITVSPVLGFLQSGFQKVADRYTYLACIPFALLYGAGLARLARGADAARFRVAMGATAALLVLLGALSWRQTLTWKDSRTLYERMVAVEPNNFFGWHNLAVQHQLDGRLEEAIEAERRSIESHPGKGNLLARTSLAQLLQRVGRREEAAEAWRAALETDPASADALRAVVAERVRAGDVDGAIGALEAAIAAEPEQLAAYEELARIHAARGDRGLVLDAWHRAARANPASARARHGVGAALLELDRDVDARPWLEQAFGMDNHDVELAIDYARVLARGGEPAQALQLLEQVLQVSPGHPRAAAAQRAIQAGQRP